MRPNLVLVEKTVSRIAQDMLLEHGITLVINVKPVSGQYTYWSLRFGLRCFFMMRLIVRKITCFRNFMYQQKKVYFLS